jgi:hypothetical protein
MKNKVHSIFVSQATSPVIPLEPHCHLPLFGIIPGINDSDSNSDVNYTLTFYLAGYCGTIYSTAITNTCNRSLYNCSIK